MSLDIRLSRGCQVAWGFRLIGGTDVKIPLTVAKVQGDSCAERSGLRVGDVLAAINGVHTSCMTHDEAQDAIVQSGDDILLSVDRGPYEDLQEMVFQTTEEPIPDIDQSLHPSEVPCDRSNTASPFLMPTKPYRPFSTEPVVEVPPLEEPIILNPNYHDEFPKIDGDALKVETIFKLPISPQYAPERYGNGERRKKTVQLADNTIKITTEGAKVEDNSALITETSSLAHITMDSEDVKFMKQMNAEIDITMIEETASYAVDESIEKDITVVEKITKETEQSFADVTSKTETKNISVSLQEESKVTQETVERAYMNNVSNNAVEIQSKNEVINKLDITSTTKSNEEVIIENNDQQTQEECILKEEKVSSSQTLSNIDDTTVVLDHTTKLEQSRNERLEHKENVSHISQKETVKTSSEQKEATVSSQSESVVRKQNVTNAKSINKEKVVEEKSDKSSSKYSTSRLLAEQRAYVLGLQTIPNIRGRTHSSYQYDLLLKTFFIHLTDVMVALSRFILTDKPLSKSNSTENITQKEETKTELDIVKTESRVEETFTNEKQSEQKQSAIVTSDRDIETSQFDDGFVASIDNEEISDHRKVSGSKMAQMSSKKSNELIQKMDAVVTEFQKNVEFESGEVKLESSNLEVHERARRSRSRSRIEEVVAKESDPLEWLSKLEDVKNSEHTTTKEEAINTSQQTITIEENNIKTSQQLKESHQIINNENMSSEAKSSSGTTYIAIVESHVYTNKNAIINEINSQELHNISSQSIEEKNEHIREELNDNVITDTVSNKQLEIEDKSVEISLEEAMAKSNIAIVTCEAITDTSQDTNAQEAVVTLETEKAIKAETNELDIMEISQTNNETRACIMVADAMLESTETKTSEISFTQSNVLEEKIELTAHEETKLESHQQNNLEEAQVTAVKFEATTAVETSSETITESSFTARLPKFTEISNVSSETSDIKINSNELTEHTFSEASETKVAETATISLNLETETNLTKLESHRHNLEEVEQLAAEYEAASIIENSLEQNSTKTLQTSQIIEESSFKAETVNSIKMNEPIDARPNTLSLNIGVHNANDEGDETDIKTPTPSTIPPTPLTDEYVFRLAIPLVESSVPALPEPIAAIPEAVEHEDLNIVKKKLIPHIETTIETIVYDNPLSTPTSPGTNIAGPAFTQHGLNTGKVDETKPKDEILEIERKSSLLASVIDETIKSIEEYKGQVINTDSTLNQAELKRGEERSNKEELIRIDNQETNRRPSKEDTTAYTNNIEQKWRSVSELMQFNTESEANTNQTCEHLTNGVIANGFHDITDTQNSVNKADNQETNRRPSKEDTTAHTNNIEQKWRSVSELMQFNTESVANTNQTCENLINGVIANGFHDIAGTQNSVNKAEVNFNDTNEVIGTNKGIISAIDGDIVMDEEVAREIGKPGMTDVKIAELISGESEMLREAHVMGVDFNKIKPTIEGMRDSEVLKALNEELTKTQEEKKKEERKWTKFLQKPQRPVPKVTFGYYGFAQDDVIQEPYKVKIVKQPKPKVAPDYKPEEFETGPLPWEERASKEPPPPPPNRQDPILVPEELPQYLEAVDPLPESEVPDLEDTGIPLPPEEKEKPIAVAEEAPENSGEARTEVEEEGEEAAEEAAEELTEDMDQNRIAQDIVGSIQSMVDPNASLEQQLMQMRAQLAALSQLPGVIQQTLELVTRQLTTLSVQESAETTSADDIAVESGENIVVTQEECHSVEERRGVLEESAEYSEKSTTVQDRSETVSEEIQKLRAEEAIMLEEQVKIEKEKKELMMLDQESRQLKQRPTPRVGRPKPAFGPLVPQERPLVLPGGRKWRKPQDAYNDQFIAETLSSQAELIQGKAKGLAYESTYLPYDERVNFMKYEKPPVSLDHLKDSDVYKLIHNMDESPVRRVDMLTSIIAESDYREKCRSVTPSTDGLLQQ